MIVMLGILFSTSLVLALREALVSKLVVRVILFLTSFPLPLRVALVAELVMSYMLSSIFLILALYTSF